MRTSGRRSATRVPVGAHDLYGLPLAIERGHDLLDAGVPAAGVGVDAGEGGGAIGEAGAVKGIGVAVEAVVGGAGRLGRLAGAAGADGGHGRGGAAQGGVAQLAGMGVAGFLAEHGAQAEAHMGVEVGAADATFLKRESLALAIFKEQLAVVHAIEGGGGEVGRGVAVELGAGATEE